jgi:hypothetical protein
METKRIIPVGSRRQVGNGTALKTRGGLRKEDLLKTKRGRWVSKKRHENMTKRMQLEEDILNKTNF